MPFFAVDPARCKRDGVCVAECPTRVLELEPGDAVPRMRPEAEEGCRHCGHCLAVCASEAVTLDGLTADALPPVQPELLPGPEQITHILRARRSIRSFTARLAGRDTLARLLDVARFAPSASNRQAVRWLAVYEPEEVHRLAGLSVDWVRAGLPSQPPPAQWFSRRLVAAWDAGRDMICRGAPHLLIACAPADYAWALSDSAIALTYVELAAPAFGLGACWGGIITNAARGWRPLQEALALPDGLIVCGAMMVGYARHRFRRLPERNPAQVTWHAPHGAVAP
jgi:nitroreductase/NAD-dependent dihydropyrimidine dehydrogenase PreA subunit